jgi:hypothetical protein
MLQSLRPAGVGPKAYCRSFCAGALCNAFTDIGRPFRGAASAIKHSDVTESVERKAATSNGSRLQGNSFTLTFNYFKGVSMRIATKFLSAAIAGLASMVALLGPGAGGVAQAQQSSSERFGDLSAAIADLRQEAGKDRRTIVKANMLLTESEAKTFWPLYDDYRADVDKINDRKVDLIKDFVAKRDGMSQDDAENLTKQYIEIEKDVIVVKQKHIGKMSKSLSARTVARFFQIDHKLDTVVDLALATRIPLIY